MALCLTPKQSDFRGYPFEVFTYTKSEQFRKNNCTGGQQGTFVTYSKTYTSYISEIDLQAKIQADSTNFNNEGQAYANSNGSCSSSCVVLNKRPYSIAGISNSQMWFDSIFTGTDDSLLITPYSKSAVLGGSSLAQNPVYNNNSYLSLPYPYYSASILYNVRTVNNSVYLFSKASSSIGACDTIQPYITIYVGKAVIYGINYIITESGILVAVYYNADWSGAYNGIDYIWYDFGTQITTLLTYHNRPVSGDYHPYFASMVMYNGVAVYVMESFYRGSTGGGPATKRKRTSFHRIDFSGGKPYQVVNLTDSDYSNQWLAQGVGVATFNRVFFIYAEGRGNNYTRKVYNLVGTGAAVPPTFFTRKIITDYFNPTVAYGVSGNTLYSYNSTSNSWSALRNL